VTYNLRSKIWLEKENQKVFGDGPWDILKRIEQTGSIRKAAAEIKMSYSQAWRLVRMIETNLGCAVLEKKAGGSGGGYSTLTPQAAKLTAAYGNFRSAAESSLDQLYQDHLARIMLEGKSAE
jgi:molybdate transport system regulatory protein